MTSVDFQPTASFDMLRQRAELVKQLRDWFHSQNYWEVETPLISQDTVVDAWLDPFSVEPFPASRPRFLQTSPEFAMKRLLAAGADRIFQICKAFRQDEQGELHNPEFTIVEWYAVGTSIEDQMSFTAELCQTLLDAGQPAADLPIEFERINYREAFQEACGCDVLDLSAAELSELARSYGLEKTVSALQNPQELDRDFWLNLLLTEVVEPTFQQRALFLYDYPVSQAALARVAPHDPRVAERFELYLNGIELCNGYRELTDADELATRNSEQNAIRRQQGKPELPESSRLIAAMQAGLPDCSGVALGLDRLLMLALGCQHLQEVIPFPFERA